MNTGITPGMYCGLAVFLAGVAVLSAPLARCLSSGGPSVGRVASLVSLAALLCGVLAASVWIGSNLEAACIECASPTGKGLVVPGYPRLPPQHDPLLAHMVLLLVCLLTAPVMLWRIIARHRRWNWVGGLAGVLAAGFAVLAFLPTVPVEGDAGIFVYLLIFPLFILLDGGLLVLSAVLLIVSLARVAVGNICRECSHELTGNVSGACPECGAAVPGRDSAKAGDGVH